MEQSSKTHSVRRWTLTFITGSFAVALALLYVLVLRSIAVQITAPPGPTTEPYPDVNSEERCAESGGRWILTPAKPTAAQGPVIEGSAAYCQGPLAFERARELQAEKSRQTSLFVFAIGGALAVASSLLVIRLKPIAPGLMLGGIAAFFIAGVQVWVLTPGLGRLVTIIVIFLILGGVGLYALRDEKKEL